MLSIFVLFAQFASASLQLYQLEFIDGGVEVMFSVEGVATIIIGGSPPRHFALNCVLTSTSGSEISWSRSDGGTLPFIQHLIPNGVQLDLQNAGPSDLVVYRCQEGNEFVTINVTISKWNDCMQVAYFRTKYTRLFVCAKMHGKYAFLQ